MGRCKKKHDPWDDNYITMSVVYEEPIAVWDGSCKKAAPSIDSLQGIVYYQLGSAQ